MTVSICINLTRDNERRETGVDKERITRNWEGKKSPRMEREKNCISIHLIIHIFDTDDLRNADGVEKYHGVNAVKLDSKITELIFVINELFPIYARIPFSFFCLLFLVFFCLSPFSLIVLAVSLPHTPSIIIIISAVLHQQLKLLWSKHISDARPTEQIGWIQANIRYENMFIHLAQSNRLNYPPTPYINIMRPPTNVMSARNHIESMARKIAFIAHMFTIQVIWMPFSGMRLTRLQDSNCKYSYRYSQVSGKLCNLAGDIWCAPYHPLHTI